MCRREYCTYKKLEKFDLLGCWTERSYLSVFQNARKIFSHAATTAIGTVQVRPVDIRVQEIKEPLRFFLRTVALRSPKGEHLVTMALWVHF